MTRARACTASGLALREITRNPAGFIVSACAVAAAAFAVVLVLALCRRHEWDSARMLAAKEMQTAQRTARLVERYRAIAQRMGHSLACIPALQVLGDYYADDYARETMPEEMADRLASAKPVGVGHVATLLRQRAHWTERRRTVLLCGVGPEQVVCDSATAPGVLLHSAPGHASLGYELHSGTGLRSGDRIALMGRPFAIDRCCPQMGTKDDITVWLNLADAQGLTNAAGRINEILVSQRYGESSDIDAVSRGIAVVLPEVQIVNLAEKSTVRAAALGEAVRAAAAELDLQRASVLELRASRRAASFGLVAAVSAAAAAVVGLLAWVNVRGRRGEIAVLFALGVTAPRRRAIFMLRPALEGLAGAIAGVGAGWALMPAIPALRGVDVWRAGGTTLLPAAAVVCMAPFLCLIATWLPVSSALRHDPAEVLVSE
jgi:hypothetical protein